MVRKLTVSATVFALALSPGIGDLVVRAQNQPQPNQSSVTPGIPVQVEVVLSRYRGNKRVSSVPFTLSVNAAPSPLSGNPSQLRIGAKVPISIDSGGSGGPTQYELVGTNIDSGATATPDGRFRVSLMIEDNSLYVDGQVVQGAAVKGTEPPIFRSFRSSNELTLRDGQSAQFTAATDRITGEVIRVDVTINLVQ